MSTGERLRQAAVAADDAWTAALRARYGSRAGEARYDRRGHASPELAALRKAYHDATEAWRRAYTVSLTHDGKFYVAAIYRGLLEVGGGMAHGKIAAMRAAIWDVRQRRKSPLFPS